MGDTFAIVTLLCFGIFVGYQWGQTDGRIQMYKDRAVCITMPSGSIQCESKKKE